MERPRAAPGKRARKLGGALLVASLTALGAWTVAHGQPGARRPHTPDVPAQGDGRVDAEVYPRTLDADVLPDAGPPAPGFDAGVLPVEREAGIVGAPRDAAVRVSPAREAGRARDGRTLRLPAEPPARPPRAFGTPEAPPGPRELDAGVARNL